MVCDSFFGILMDLGSWMFFLFGSGGFMWFLEFLELLVSVGSAIEQLFFGGAGYLRLALELRFGLQLVRANIERAPWKITCKRRWLSQQCFLCYPKMAGSCWFYPH